MEVRGNVSFEDGNSKVSVSNLLITNDVFSPRDEFVRGVTANLLTISELQIPPVDGMMPTTLCITQCPCTGNITNVDPANGNVTYVPSERPGTLDLYQYKINDNCGVQHLVTQYICQSPGLAPFLNNVCVDPRYVTEPDMDEDDKAEDGSLTVDFVLGPVDLADTALPGDYPIDWSSVQIKSLEIHVESTEPGMNFDCTDMPGFPYGTSDLTRNSSTTWSYDGGFYTLNIEVFVGTTLPGAEFPLSESEMAVCFTFDNDNAFSPIVKVIFDVADVNGQRSNCACAFFGIDGDPA